MPHFGGTGLYGLHYLFWSRGDEVPYRILRHIIFTKLFSALKDKIDKKKRFKEIDKIHIMFGINWN